MATPLRMPDMGTVEGQVTLVRWLKAEGDTVALGEPLFEVETDKGVSEVEAALAGVLLRRMAADGARVAAGDTIALIQRPGEKEETPASVPPAAPAVPPAAPARPRIAPTIRALAEKHGVDLDAVTATGPGGTITRADVLKARGSPGPAARSNQAIVAQKVTQSHREKPVFHVVASVDMSAALAFREKQRVSYDSLFVKAAGIALGEFPTFVGGRASIDVAVAIGVDEDLYAPAVRNPGAKSVGEISAQIEELARRARARTLHARDTEGSCFLVSNLGMFPVESFDAVIYPEHSAALAIGSIVRTVIPDGAGTRAAPLARMTLTVDHRFNNGRTAARFIARVKQILETGAFS